MEDTNIRNRIKLISMFSKIIRFCVGIVRLVVLSMVSKVVLIVVFHIFHINNNNIIQKSITKEGRVGERVVDPNRRATGWIDEQKDGLQADR